MLWEQYGQMVSGRMFDYDKVYQDNPMVVDGKTYRHFTNVRINEGKYREIYVWLKEMGYPIIFRQPAFSLRGEELTNHEAVFVEESNFIQVRKLVDQERKKGARNF